MMVAPSLLNKGEHRLFWREELQAYENVAV